MRSIRGSGMRPKTATPLNASRGRCPDGSQIVPAASLTRPIASTAGPHYDAAMTNIQTARHLATITREAAARAYEADAGTSGKIAVWFMTVLTTLHAGGLVAALQYSEKLAMPYATQWSLLSGLVATLLGAVAALVHYNSLADRWRQEMHYEIEGAQELSEAASAFAETATKADWAASGLSIVSIGALALAGVFAITNLN